MIGDESQQREIEEKALEEEEENVKVVLQPEPQHRVVVVDPPVEKKPAKKRKKKHFREAADLFKAFGKKVKKWVRKEMYMDYYRGHVIYFVLMTLLMSVIVYALEGEQIPWLDCWFTTASALTLTGLSVIDFTTTTVATKTIVMCLIIMGSQSAFAIIPLLVRQVKYRWDHRKTKNGWWDLACLPSNWVLADDLPRSDLEELKILSFLVRAYIYYWALWVVPGFIILMMYCYLNDPAKQVLEDYNLEPWAFVSFHTLSAFHNAGVSLFPDSLIPFRTDRTIILITCVLISAGNTLLPVFMRILLSWAESHSKNPKKASNMHTVLSNPRRFTTHIFSGKETVALFFVWLITTLFQFIFYTATPYNASYTQDLGDKALDMFFTTVSTRTAGFNVLDFEKLRAGILMLQVLLMYLSSYPFIVTVRSSYKVRVDVAHEDLYKQKSKANDISESLTTVREDPSTSSPKRQMPKRPAASSVPDVVRSFSSTAILTSTAASSSSSLLSTGQKQNKVKLISDNGSTSKEELKKTLSNDILWLAISTWLIASVNPWLDIDSLFRLMWEVVSAYGNVGLSLPIPGSLGSFTASLNWFGKIVIIVLMVAGRHRSVPHGLDSAVAPVAEQDAATNLRAQQTVTRNSFIKRRNHSTSQIPDAWFTLDQRT